MARKIKRHHGHAAVLGQNIFRVACRRMIILVSAKTVTENHNPFCRSWFF